VREVQAETVLQRDEVARDGGRITGQSNTPTAAPEASNGRVERDLPLVELDCWAAYEASVRA